MLFLIFDLFNQKINGRYNYSRFEIFATETGSDYLRGLLEGKDTSYTAAFYLGETPSINGGIKSFGVYNQESSNKFYYLLSDIFNDTTSQAVSFYNRSYYLPNARPSSAAGRPR